MARGIDKIDTHLLVRRPAGATDSNLGANWASGWRDAKPAGAAVPGIWCVALLWLGKAAIGGGSLDHHQQSKDGDGGGQNSAHPPGRASAMRVHYTDSFSHMKNAGNHDKQETAAINSNEQLLFVATR